MGVWGLGCPANGWGGVVEVGPCLLWLGVLLGGHIVLGVNGSCHPVHGLSSFQG